MPAPRYSDQPLRRPLLTCPRCWQPMRIVTVEIGDGREQIQLVCDLCKTEATQDQPST